MRKQILAAILVSVSFLGCQKQEDSSVLVQQYVAFSISQIDPISFKNLDEVICPLDETGNLKTPTVARIVINGTAYYPEVYFLNGKLYTQSIKLALPGGAEASYNISHFALLESIDGDVIMATPAKGSFYAAYVSNGVDFDINITPFGKTEVPIEVLCFIPAVFDLFGYNSIQSEKLYDSQYFTN